MYDLQSQLISEILYLTDNSYRGLLTEKLKYVETVAHFNIDKALNCYFQKTEVMEKEKLIRLLFFWCDLYNFVIGVGLVVESQVELAFRSHRWLLMESWPPP